MQMDTTDLTIAANRIGLLSDLLLLLAEEQNLLKEKQRTSPAKQEAPPPREKANCPNQLLVAGTWLLSLSMVIISIATTRGVRDNLPIPEEEVSI